MFPWYLLSGIVAGIALGSLGIDWGAINVPVLLSLGLPSMPAKGSVLASEVVVSASGSLVHGKMKNVKAGLSLGLLFGLVGAFIGAYLSKGISEEGFKAIIGIYELLAGITLIKFRTRNLIDVESNSGLGYVFGIGFLAGFVNGFLGTGWGPIGVTLLILFGAMPKKVVGSSLIARIGIAGSATVYYALSGYVPLGVFCWLTIGGIIGCVIGSLLCRRVSEEKMKFVIGSLVLALGVEVLGKLAFSAL